MAKYSIEVIIPIVFVENSKAQDLYWSQNQHEREIENHCVGHSSTETTLDHVSTQDQKQ